MTKAEPLREAAARHTPEYQMPHSIALLRTPDKGTGLVARTDMAAGAEVFRFVGRLVPAGQQTAMALQVGEDMFLESTAGFDNNLNHSCAPNCYVKFGATPDDVTLVARTDIKAGEELSFDYNTTEEDLVAQGCAFQCRCGAANCRGEIRGFRYLSEQQKREISDYLSPYLRREFDRAAGRT